MERRRHKLRLTLCQNAWRGLGTTDRPTTPSVQPFPKLENQVKVGGSHEQKERDTARRASSPCLDEKQKEIHTKT